MLTNKVFVLLALQTIKKLSPSYYTQMRFCKLLTLINYLGLFI